VLFPGDFVYLQLRLAQHSNMTDGDLTVSLYDRATDTLQCEPWVFTSDDLTAPRRAWQRIGLMTPDLVGASLVPGTQYYIKITSPASASQGWHVQVANGGQSTGPVGGPPAGSDDATFGGSANVPTINGTEEPNMDVEFLLSTPPDTPTGFTATANGEQCGIDFISLGWTPPVPIVNCLEFSYYEIQRSDDLGDTWGCIAKITASGLTTFDDYESKRNSPAQYRMRVAPEAPVYLRRRDATEVGLVSNESRAHRVLQRTSSGGSASRERHDPSARPQLPDRVRGAGGPGHDLRCARAAARRIVRVRRRPVLRLRVVRLRRVPADPQHRPRWVVLRLCAQRVR
jgi:hypothetical protein